MSTDNTNDTQESDSDRIERNVKLYNPLELLAYLLIGVTTLTSTIASISHEFYKSVSGRKVYKELWEERDCATRNLYHTASSTQELVLGKKAIEKAFDNAVDEKLAIVGIPKATGFISYAKRTWVQFRTLKTYEKRNVGVRLGMIAAVAIAAAWFLPRHSQKKAQDNSGKENTKPDNTERAADSMGQLSDSRDADRKIHTTDAMKKISSTEAGFASAVDTARSATDNAERQVP